MALSPIDGKIVAACSYGGGDRWRELVGDSGVVGVEGGGRPR